VSRREGRYSISDRGAAFAAAGSPSGWRSVAETIVAGFNVNVSRRGEVFLPATARRELSWVAALPQRVAEASAAFYGALLELE
jgi:hypothetical protein